MKIKQRNILIMYKHFYQLLAISWMMLAAMACGSPVDPSASPQPDSTPKDTSPHQPGSTSKDTSPHQPDSTPKDTSPHQPGSTRSSSPNDQESKIEAAMAAVQEFRTQPLPDTLPGKLFDALSRAVGNNAKIKKRIDGVPPINIEKAEKGIKAIKKLQKMGPFLDELKKGTVDKANIVAKVSELKAKFSEEDSFSFTKLSELTTQVTEILALKESDLQAGRANVILVDTRPYMTSRDKISSSDKGQIEQYLAAIKKLTSIDL